MRSLGLLVGLALSLGCLVGCGAGPSSNRLTYAQVQALNPGVTADWVLAEYPGGSVQRDQAGRVRMTEHGVTDPYGKGQSLFLEYDARGVCVKKTYTGAVLRPPK